MRSLQECRGDPPHHAGRDRYARTAPNERAIHCLTARALASPSRSNRTAIAEPTLVDSYSSRESSFSCDEVASPIRRSVHSRSGIPRVKLEIRELLAPSVNAS
jgi:hypothetical protein